jgi:hypothetical protein
VWVATLFLAFWELAFYFVHTTAMKLYETPGTDKLPAIVHTYGSPAFFSMMYQSGAFDQKTNIA